MLREYCKHKSINLTFGERATDIVTVEELREEDTDGMFPQSIVVVDDFMLEFLNIAERNFT